MYNLLVRWIASAAVLGLGISFAAAGTASGIPRCHGEEVRVRNAGPGSPETGEIVRDFYVWNTGRHVCSIGGYPGVRLLDHGQALPFTYRWGGRYADTRAKPRTVVLKPNAKVWFRVAKYRCDGKTLRVARAVAVFPPNTTPRRVVRFGLYPVFGYCKAFRGRNEDDPGNTVYIGSVRL